MGPAPEIVSPDILVLAATTIVCRGYMGAKGHSGHIFTGRMWPYGARKGEEGANVCSSGPRRLCAVMNFGPPRNSALDPSLIETNSLSPHGYILSIMPTLCANKERGNKWGEEGGRGEKNNTTTTAAMQNIEEANSQIKLEN